MNHHREPIRVQEFAVPTITAKDQAQIARGYREFFRRLGIDTEALNVGHVPMTADQKRQHRKRMAALADEGGTL